MMSDIDWSKAPEGATHYNMGNELFYKCEQNPICIKFWHSKWEVSCHWRLPPNLVKRPDSPEWNGEGLPPVGCLCEFKPDPSIEAWIKCVFVAKLNNEYIVDVLVNDFMRCGLDRMKAIDGRFRPIKTERERAIDFLEMDLRKLYKDNYLVTATALYDAGYRKVSDDS